MNCRSDTAMSAAPAGCGVRRAAAAQRPCVMMRRSRPSDYASAASLSARRPEASVRRPRIPPALQHMPAPRPFCWLRACLTPALRLISVLTVLSPAHAARLPAELPMQAPKPPPDGSGCGAASLAGRRRQDAAAAAAIGLSSFRLRCTVGQRSRSTIAGTLGAPRSVYCVLLCGERCSFESV